MNRTLLAGGAVSHLDMSCLMTKMARNLPARPGQLY